MAAWGGVSRDGLSQPPHTAGSPFLPQDRGSWTSHAPRQRCEEPWGTRLRRVLRWLRAWRGLGEPGGGPRGGHLGQSQAGAGSAEDPSQLQAVLEIGLAERRDKWYQWWVPREERPWRLRGLFWHHHVYQLKLKSLSRVWLFVTPWPVAHQAPPSMGFPRRKYWSGLPFPPPGDLPDPGSEPGSAALQADTLPVSHDTNSSTSVPLGQEGGREKGNQKLRIRPKGT